MLAQLTISNFAIVRELEIDFHAGMTAITGETGAGKSIAIDALGLCLGGRSEAAMVRAGAGRADVSARFSLKDTPAARVWLEENQLDDQQECILRRVVSADGRSRGFINGTAVPVSQLRELGQLLIQIHGQHAHQLLLKPEHQKRLLDAYAHQTDLMAEMKQAYRQWHQSCAQLAQYQQQSLEQESRMQLLQYQLKELNDFAPQAGEYEQVDEEHKRLSNGGQLLSLSQDALQVLAENDEQNVLSMLNHAKHSLQELHQQLLEEFAQISRHEENYEALVQDVERHHRFALDVAKRLHLLRIESANELASLITDSIHALAMPHGQLMIEAKWQPEHLSAEGADRIEFLVSTNPGQPLAPLAKVASGGELSRIALAVQVITAQKMETPALIFDEVDVGISGPTAATVGKLLRQLGESTQVMCVTHLPQVAGSGHHHFYVNKRTDGAETETDMTLLDKAARLQELARLLGGSEITRNTLANAKELLAA